MLADVVHREIVRNPEKPRGKRRPLPPEIADSFEHFEKYLFSQVLSVGGVANLQVDVSVDAFEVAFIEPTNGLWIARLCAFYPCALIFLWPHRDAPWQSALVGWHLKAK